MPSSRVNTEYSIHQVWHLPSTVYAEYDIHQVQHILSTAYTAYWIIPSSTASCSHPVSQLSAVHDGFISLHLHNYELTSELSPRSCCASIPNYHLQIEYLQVLIQSLFIMATRCISKLAQSHPPSEYPNSHHHRLAVYPQTRSITASKFTSSRF